TTTITVVAPGTTPVTDTTDPVVDLNGPGTGAQAGVDLTLSLTGDAKGVSVNIADTTATVFDDSKVINGATIDLSGNLSGDKLDTSHVDLSGTAISFGAGTTETHIVLVGTGTDAEYQAIIKAITFNTTSTEAGARTVDVEVTDGAKNTGSATTTINLAAPAATNTAPTITFDGNAYHENGDAVYIVKNLAIADTGGDQQLSGAVITLTHMQADDLINSSYATGDGHTTLGIDYTLTPTQQPDGTTTIVLTGNASIDDYQKLISSITFAESGPSATPVARGVTIEVTDSNTDATQNLPGSYSDSLSVEANAVPTLDLDAATNTGTAGNDFAATYSVGHTATVAIAGDVQISDTDNTTLKSATVTIDGAYLTGDALNIVKANLPSGITANTDTAGKIVLTSATGSTLAQFQDAIKGITFSTTSDVTTDRVINVTVNDGLVDSAVAKSTISVTANSAPVLDLNGPGIDTAHQGNDFSTTYVEKDAGVSIADPTIEIDDLDHDSSTIYTVTVTLNGAVTTDGDILTVGSLSGGITASAPAGSVITLTGVPGTTLTQLQDAIKGITFSNTSTNPSTVDRTVLVVVEDGNGGSASATTTIHVQTHNDAPVVDLNGPDTVAGTSNGIDFAASVTQNHGSVAIAAPTASVSDPDGVDAQIHGATIQISADSLSTGDVLTVVGTLPDGIVADTTSGTSIVLSGNASQAAYATAIQAITFSTTSSTEGPRTVSVTVNDGTVDSAPAKTVIAVTANDAPVVDLNGPGTDTAHAGNDFTTVFTEGSPAVHIAADAIIIIDGDNANLQGADIVLNSPAVGDALSYAAVAALNNGVSVDPASTSTHVILTGDASKDAYAAAIKAITFNNDQDNLDVTPRTVSITVNDGTGAAATASTSTTTINIVATNDAPVVDLNGPDTVAGTSNGIDFAASVTQNHGSVAIAAPTGSVSDPDGVDAQIHGATIQISADSLSTGDLLTVVGTLPDGIVADTTSGTSIVLSGNASQAAYATAIQAITFSTTSSTEGPRTVSVTVNDGTVDSAPAKTVIAVTANDLPVADLSGSSTDGTNNYSVSYAEQAAPISIAPNVSITDHDNANLKQAVVTLTTTETKDTLSASAIVASNPAFAGIIATTSTDGKVITLTGDASKSAYEAAIKAITFGSTSDEPSQATRVPTVTIQLDDGSGITASTPASVISITVNPINDAPIVDLAGYTATVVQGHDGVAIAGSAVSITDKDGSTLSKVSIDVGTGAKAGDTLSIEAGDLPTGITVDASSTAQHLVLTGVASEALYQQALQKVIFSTSAGTGDRTINVTADDGQSQFNTGTSSSTISVTANAAPIADLNGANDNSGTDTQHDGINYAVNYGEQAPAISIAPNLTIVDTDNDNLQGAKITLASAESLDKLDITAINPALGIIATLDGNVVTLTGNATKANYEAAIKAITFSSTSDEPGQVDRSATVTVQLDDGTGITASTPASVTTITVQPVNDAPTVDLNGPGTDAAHAGTDYAATVTSGHAGVSISSAAVSVGDVDNTTLASVKVSIVSAQTGDVLDTSKVASLTNNTVSATVGADGVITLSSTSATTPATL
ncbi:beta strand repeat-containing protein, partial [Pseudomonas sp. NPDC087358]|uniref:beta strand repeat-containing protein n=1 Tax=Pseudomonas sp. NPDC087358 TaxID=3364439 RepID=UPI00384B53FC